MANPIQLLDLSQARIRTSEGAGTTTLTIDDFRHQVFNLSAARTCMLPTTGVKKGMKWVVENVGTFLLTVQSSGANTISTVLGTKLTATALQDIPTSAAHWLVSNPGETGQSSGGPTLSSTSRINLVTLALPKGVWLVSGGLNGNQAGGGSYLGVNLTTTSDGSGEILGLNSGLQAPIGGGSGSLYNILLPGVTIVSQGSTTMYLGFTSVSNGTSGAGCTGRIHAVRLN